MPGAASDDPELLTIAEVAALTRLTRKTLRNRRYAGKPPASRKVGGRIVYSRAEVLRFLSQDDAPIDQPAETRDWQSSRGGTSGG